MNSMTTRYLRQELIEGFGQHGQQRLGAARIAVIGAGGLGSPILTYLAAAGVGELRVFDSDVVEETNLNRQVLFTPGDVGFPKVELAADRLPRLNPDVSVRCHRIRVGVDSESELNGIDHLVDAVDNLGTRADLCRLAERLHVPVTFTAIESWRGIIHTYNPGDSSSACFHCVFGDDVAARTTPIPVLGAAVGSLGARTAVTVVRRIVLGDTALDRLVEQTDFATGATRRTAIKPRGACRCAERGGGR